MIISHKFKFIFIKSTKTAGTSVEHYLYNYCGPDDIITGTLEDWSKEQNTDQLKISRLRYKYLTEVSKNVLKLNLRKAAAHLIKPGINKLGYVSPHLSASDVRYLVGEEIWNQYLTFTIERNPWDQTISRYHYIKESKKSHLTIDQFINSDASRIHNYDLYSDKQGNPIVNKILRYEHLDIELGQLLNSLEIPWNGSLGIRMKSNFRPKHHSHSRELTQEQIDTIASRSHKVLEHFNYLPPTTHK